MRDPSDTWESRSRVEKLVGQLIELSRDEAACRALGVDGGVAEQVDISFLDDPVDYVAYDLAEALKAAEDDAGEPHEVPPLPEEVLRELSAIEAAADLELAGEEVPSTATTST